MAILKCKMCGGELSIVENQTVCTCEYCGTQQTLPRINDDRRANLYDRANHFRRANEFDKAMAMYEQILNEDNTDAEAYWSLVLCRYGIEYVEDPVSHKRVPTVNRMQYTSILADEDYKAALEYGDISQRVLYEEEAKAIDTIQKGILAISQKEEPFDIFICYKETDSRGQRTPDSVLAQDLYFQLKNEGYKVFFSRITLEDKLGAAYEPYIFAALNSAKIMVVIGTKPEYFNAVWVKNEWSRFLSLIKKGDGKMLIPAYKDMDPYDMPDEFSHLQAQDMSKLGFMQDLIRGIKKIVKKDTPKKEAAPQPAVVTASVNTASLLKRAWIFIEDGDEERADEMCEQVLNQDPECSEAYIIKLLIDLNMSSTEELSLYPTPIDEFSNYVKALRYAKSDADKARIKGYNDAILARIEAQIEAKYVAAIDLYNAGEYLRAANAFKEIEDYKDSAQRIELCEESYMEAEIAAKYHAGNLYLEKQEYAKAKAEFELIPMHKDAKEKIAICRQCIEKDSVYNAARNLMTGSDIYTYQRALHKLKELPSDWRDTASLIDQCDKKIAALTAEQQRQKKKATITTIIVLSVIAVIIAAAVIIGVVINSSKKAQYAIALGLIEDGKISEAYEILDGLNYENSDDYANICRDYLNGSYADYIQKYNLTEFAIPDGTTSIAYESFYNCTSLTSVTIPNSVTNIEDRAFMGCTGLTSIVIPDGVTRIGEQAFEDCAGINSLTVPNTSISYNAFSGCNSITTLVTHADALSSIPTDNVATVVITGGESIPYQAFYNSTSLSSVTLADSITTIDSYAFYGCTSLTEITLPKNLEYIESSSFSGCSALTEITLPAGLITIGSYAFSGCSALTEISIPSSVTGLDSYAFEYCSELDSVTIEGNIDSLGYSIFYSCDKITSINVPADMIGLLSTEYLESAVINSGTTIPSGAFNGCYNLTSVTLPDTITEIGDQAFNNCTALTEIILPDGITRIGSHAFYGCESFTAIELPENLETIDSSAFSGCIALESITIPDNVTTINSYAFNGCTALTSFTLPSGIEYIGDYAFQNCTSLTSIKIPKTLSDFGSSVFYGCDNITSATVSCSAINLLPKSSLTNIVISGGSSIPSYAFNGCTNLSKVTLSEGITYIGNSAFYGCTGITSITIPNSVTDIGSEAFYNCYKLVEVIYNGDNLMIYKGGSTNGYVAYYAKEVHSGSSKLTSKNDFVFYDDGSSVTLLGYSGSATDITLPDDYNDSGYSLHKYAFYGNTNLTSIVVPNSVTSIGNYTFSGCDSLTSISLPFIGASATDYNGTGYFGYIFGASSYNYVYSYIPSTLKTVKITGDITYVPACAFYDCDNITSITLPGTVTKINEYAFQSCDGLVRFKVPEGVTEIGNSAFASSSNLVYVELPSTLTTLGEYAFRYCSTLSEVKFADGCQLTAINTSTFYECENLSVINLPDSITTIGEYAFYECYVLSDIELPESIKEIGQYAFYRCYELTDISIPEGATTIGSSAFRETNGITLVKLPSTITSLGSCAFYKCENLEKVIFAEGCQLNHIDESAFNECTKLTDINIPDSVTVIGASAFASCSSLKNTALPSNLETIGNNAFYDCDGMTRVILPDSVTSLGSYAFYACDNLEFVKLSENLRTISSYTFDYCTKLNTVIITKSVTYIYGAFNYCNTLTSVYYTGSRSEWLGVSTSNSFYNATIYYYSEIEPESDDYRYWTYDTDNEIIIW